MDNERFSQGVCPIGRALSLVGDAWSMMILRDAAYGHTRFDQFRVSLGIAPNILTRRLVALTEAGLFEKRPYSEHPPREEYVMTARGRDFMPILLVLGAWGAKHCGGGPISRSVDAETGNTIDAVVVDRGSGRPVSEIAIKIALPETSASP